MENVQAQDINEKKELEPVRRFLFWYKVRKGSVLIVETLFKSKERVLKPGVHFAVPFRKIRAIVDSKEVTIPDKMVGLECNTRDNSEVKLDITWNYNIVDPVKYLYSTEKISEVFKPTLSESFKSFAKARTYEELSEVIFNINDENDYATYNLKRKLLSYEKEFGIKVRHIRIADVHITENEKETRRGLVEAELRRKIAEKDLETQRLKNQADAEKIKSLGAAEAAALDARFEVLDKKGFSKGQQLTHENMYNLSSGNATVFTNLDTANNDNSNQVRNAYITAEMVKRNNENSVTDSSRKSRLERLNAMKKEVEQVSEQVKQEQKTLQR